MCYKFSLYIFATKPKQQSGQTAYDKTRLYRHLRSDGAGIGYQRDMIYGHVMLRTVMILFTWQFHFLLAFCTRFTLQFQLNILKISVDYQKKTHNSRKGLEVGQTKTERKNLYDIKQCVLCF